LRSSIRVLLAIFGWLMQLSGERSCMSERVKAQAASEVVEVAEGVDADSR
jgi:hypothetical protein